MLAAKNSNIPLMRTLLDSGAVVDTADGSGNTALMYAANFQKSDAAVRLLLESGANFRRRNDERMTALMIAASKNPDEKIVKALLERRSGADIDVREAFSCAAVSGASAEVLSEFLRRGVPIDSRVGGKTALMLAAEKNSSEGTIRWLLANGASRTERTLEGKCAYDLAKENPLLAGSKIVDELNPVRRAR